MLHEKSDNAAGTAADCSVAEPEGITDPHLRKLYHEYRDELCNYVRSRFGRGPFDPEDIVQSAFVRFAEQGEPGKIDNPRAFLFVSVRNLAVDEYRKANIRLAHRQSTLNDNNDEDFSDNLTPENVIYKRQKCELLWESINKLPKMQRTVLLMHRLDRLPYSQIAGLTGLSESKIRRHIARSLERIMRDLKRAELY